MSSSRRALLLGLLGCGILGDARAADAATLDADVRAAIGRFYESVDGGRELARNAVGMLVFPSVLKGGLVFGGEYGEGALLVGGQTVDYYTTAAASVGLQLGAQVRTQILLFMTSAALTRFRASRGWEVGVDGTVALATSGPGGALDRASLHEPIVAFVFTNKGLMVDLSLEGSKITRLAR